MKTLKRTRKKLKHQESHRRATEKLLAGLLIKVLKNFLRAWGKEALRRQRGKKVTRGGKQFSLR